MTSHLTCVRTDSRIPQFPNIYHASHHCLIMQTIHNIQHISTTWTFFFLLQNNLTLSSLTKSLGEVSQPLLHLSVMLCSGALPAWADELQWQSSWCEWHTAPAEVRYSLLGKTGGIFRTHVPHSENVNGSQPALKLLALTGTGMKFPLK